MLNDKRGGIVLMSSLAGNQGSGFLATYAASKAFNRILAESLWFEWKNEINGCDRMLCRRYPDTKFHSVETEKNQHARTQTPVARGSGE